VWLLDMPLGGAILLGAILAPTDPVLASGLREDASPRPDRVGFSLAGEGGLNDGAAFPFVMLGLGLLGLADLGPGLARWWLVDVLWSTLGGLAIGALFGAATGRLVVYLRSHHGEAVGLDEFLSLGLVAMAYGLAQVSLASGFLAVFAAGLAFQRVGENARAARALLAPLDRPLGAPVRAAVLAAHASDMRESVQAFNGQLEKLAELTLVLVVGAMLAYAAVPLAVWWFVPLVLVVIRPLSVLVASAGESLSRPQQAMIGWFGIRGIGSVFYLLFSLHRGIDPGLAGTLVSLTLWTVSASIVLHGISAGPLMKLYLRSRRN
jgi:NhaP-type Na+/H+ or K+/H+ antiporter